MHDGTTQQDRAPRTIAGRLVTTGGRTDIEAVSVWFAYQPVDGESVTVGSTSDAAGRFEFDLPDAPLRTASVGAVVEGADVVDLEPDGGRLEPGDVVIVVDDIVPPHLRYACFG
ncbi:MAG TPA: hypothetical protein VHK88_02290 [Aquihabitans sp.]|nr:hypothetical protein [Aquihabitans sp.]